MLQHGLYNPVSNRCFLSVHQAGKSKLATKVSTFLFSKYSVSSPHSITCANDLGECKLKIINNNCQISLDDFIFEQQLGSQCLELFLSPQQVNKASFLLKPAKDVLCILNHQFCQSWGISCTQGKEFYKYEKLAVCAIIVPLLLISRMCLYTSPLFCLLRTEISSSNPSCVFQGRRTTTGYGHFLTRTPMSC